MNVIKSKYGNSSFWLDKFDTDVENEFLSNDERKNNNLFALASRKRAIGNYVSILTGKQYPIKFKTRGDSYTDGHQIVISSQIDEPADFDVAVGLALHEGSHIKLSDFDFLVKLENYITLKLTGELVQKLQEMGYDDNEYGVVNNIKSTVKDILNYIEDRRIDNFVYKTSPGYRDYYISLYDKFFNSPLIEKGLKSDEFTDETLESYMFRIINLHSRNTRLDSLKGLRDIYKLINLKAIDRLKTTQDAFDVSWEVYEIIINNIFENFENGNSNQSQNTNNSENNNVEISDDENDEMGGTGSPLSNQQGSKSPEKKDDKTQLSNTQKDLLKKKIKKQKDFLNGEISKKAISKKDEEKIEMIDESGAELKTVGKDYQNEYGKVSGGIECIIVKKVDERLMLSDEFPFSSREWISNTLKIRYQEEVDKGIRLGTILSKKLQTRSEIRDTIFNRQKNGKIDRRMISSLGFGNENVFFTKDVDFYNDANLHVSIDASGSMSGNKWERTLVNVVALCKAVDMISNLQIQVSLRSCHHSKPFIAIVYDSRVDKFSKVKKLFPSLHTSGTTPEGLTFEAILDDMVKGTNGVDSYFLNISDGEPYFQGNGFFYSGYSAARHTKKMVDKIQEMGVKVISYFISDYSSDSYSKKIFGLAYGNKSNYIDVTSVSEVSKTMNKMFMEKK